MLTTDPKPYKNTQHYKAKYTHDRVYSLDIEKIINGTTTYDAHVTHIDGEPVDMGVLSETERAVMFSVEEAAENHCKRIGIGIEKGGEEV